MARKLTSLAGGLAALVLPLAIAAPAAAETDDVRTFRAEVGALNNSGASGTVTVALDTGTNMATVNVDVSGVLADTPHAQHLHFGPDARHVCPDMSLADSEAGNEVRTNPDVLASVEARQAYGPVNISLTTEGPTGAGAALDLERFPTAPGGTIEYERTIELTDEQVGYLTAGKYVFAAHGIDYTGDGAYSPETAPSPLAVAALGDKGRSVPLEATAPYGCGVLTATQVEQMPEGGMATGGGSTAGIENLGLLAFGGTALVGAGAVFAARRRTRGQS